MFLDFSNVSKPIYTLNFIFLELLEVPEQCDDHTNEWVMKKPFFVYVEIRIILNVIIWI